jgi:uncharacterized membrane protein YfcA
LADLATWQIVTIGLLFVWSGFVRSALGFGGSVLTLPFLLLVDNQPLVYLPIIAVHMLLFSSVTVFLSHRRNVNAGLPIAEGSVNWPFVRYALVLMIIPKLLGVAGVILLPTNIVTGFIYAIVAVYAVSYILNRPFESKSKVVDVVSLLVGGYISGISLVAAPLVVPVAVRHVERAQLRDTLFVLWFVLVAVKLAAFAYSGIDLQWQQHLWLLPCATVGHLVGLRFHAYSLTADTRLFYRVLGCGLLAVSVAGLLRLA